MLYLVNAGKFDDSYYNSRDCKFASDWIDDLDTALETYLGVIDYPWAEVSLYDNEGEYMMTISPSRANALNAQSAKPGELTTADFL